MNPTHADIIKQQVEAFAAAFACTQDNCCGGLVVHDTAAEAFEDFLTQFADAIAQATEKAGEVEEVALPTRPCVNAEQHMFGTCFACEKTKGINAAIAQSRRQLDEHFGRLQREAGGFFLRNTAGHWRGYDSDKKPENGSEQP